MVSKVYLTRPIGNTGLSTPRHSHHYTATRMLSSAPSGAYLASASPSRYATPGPFGLSETYLLKQQSPRTVVSGAQLNGADEASTTRGDRRLYRSRAHATTAEARRDDHPWQFGDAANVLRADAADALQRVPCQPEVARSAQIDLVDVLQISLILPIDQQSRM